MKTTRLLAGSAALASLLVSGTSVAETRVGADVGVNVGVATNPFGSTTNSAASGTLNGSFAPFLTLVSPTGSTTLRGNVSHTEYTRLYDGTTDYTVSLSTAHKISPQASLTGGLSYSSYVNNGLFPVINPVIGAPINPNDPIFVDPSAGANLRERTEVLSGNVGLSFAVSPRDSIDLSARGTQVSFPNGSALSQGYKSYGGSAYYMRTISANTSIGAGLDFMRNDYDNPAFGSSTQYSPTARLTTRLAPRLSLNVSAGLTFSQTDVLGGSVNSTAFSGSVGLCRDGERARFCVTGSHGISPSTLTGSSKVTSLGASYQYKLTPRSNISANLSYSRSQSLSNIPNIGNLANQDADYGQVGISYDRQILERLSAVVSAGYSDSFGSLVQRGSNLFGSIGLRYRLGDPR